ncbi:interleukin 21 receptor, tandem duplicate 2 isoform X1 [Amia ocellicauda]|uniref:interleukin 21 receptor, tandem duplicate 2 isoform X1 n=2 Tax=Amia ocellicauda TaxID=2972642 RepID=UPI0034646C51
MKHGSRLLAFLWVIYGSGGLSGAARSEDHSALPYCVNDYVVTVNCTMKIPANDTDDTTYYLEMLYILNDRPFTCQFEKQVDIYQCAFDVTDEFIDADTYLITLYRTLNGQTSAFETFSYTPHHFIKLRTPINFSVNESMPQECVFTWKRNYDRLLLLQMSLHHELQFHKKGYPNSVKFIHNTSNLNEIRLEKAELETDTQYVARVRSYFDGKHYRGNWSDWSSEVEWRTEPSVRHTKKGEPDFLMMFLQIILPLAIVAAVLLFLYFTVPARLGMISFRKVPTPAPFFQPLYSNYKGNFRNWLLSDGLSGESFRRDEDLKIDTLIEARPINKVESGFLTWAPPSAVCPITYVKPNCKDGSLCGDKSPDHDWPEMLLVTDGPCSPHPAFLKASFEEMFGSLPLDAAEATELDSGCVDLTQSLDSSWPSPALSFELPAEPESVCYSDEYCTLSDTHNGLVPTKRGKPAIKSGEQDMGSPPPSEGSSSDDNENRSHDSQMERNSEDSCCDSL